MSCNNVKKDNERGELMIEATIVVVVTLMVTMLILDMVLMVYHQEIVTAAAESAASDVANVYSNVCKEPFIGVETEDYISNCNPYRYWGIPFSDIDFGANNAINLSNKKKARWLTCFRLAQSELADEESNSWDKVTITYENNPYAMITLVVNIERTYPVLVANPLEFFGIDPKYTVKASEKAMCYDIMHQMSNSKLRQEIVDGITGSIFLVDYISKLESLISKISSIL